MSAHSVIAELALTICVQQVASCPPNTQAATLDIKQAYCCLPIAPAHKKYLTFHWENNFYVQHKAIEGLASTGGIQSHVANTCVAILHTLGIHPIFKWVDNFVIFCSPSPPPPHGSPSPEPPQTYAYGLHQLLSITNPLGIPWHPISSKGQDFDTHFKYLGFNWDLSAQTVSLPPDKQQHALDKLALFLNLTFHSVTQ